MSLTFAEATSEHPGDLAASLDDRVRCSNNREKERERERKKKEKKRILE